MNVYMYTYIYIFIDIYVNIYINISPHTYINKKYTYIRLYA